MENYFGGRSKDLPVLRGHRSLQKMRRQGGARDQEALVQIAADRSLRRLRRLREV